MAAWVGATFTVLRVHITDTLDADPETAVGSGYSGRTGTVNSVLSAALMDLCRRDLQSRVNISRQKHASRSIPMCGLSASRVTVLDAVVLHSAPIRA
jgi:hypothetical protein